MSSNAGIAPGHVVTASPPGEVTPFPPGEDADIFVSAANGNDANDGLTPGTAVLTLARAYAIAESQEDPGLTVIHMGSGTYAWLPMPFALTIIGDGAGQPGDTGFTTVATGVSAAGTNATNLTLAAPVAVNLYRGLTLEWRSGAASGHRKSVRDNTATVVTPVEVAGYPTAVINPGVGSNFAILRPAVIFQSTAIEVSSTFAIMDGLGTSSREYYPAALVNLRFQMSAAAAIGVISATRGRLFGVEINPGTVYLVDSQVDAGYVVPQAALNAWAIRVGLTGFADITDWIGWGATWPAAVAADQSWFVNPASVLQGMFVFGTIVPSLLEAGAASSLFGTIEINGGSALGEVSLFGGSWIQGNTNILFTCRRFLAAFGATIQSTGMSCDAAATGTPMTLERFTKAIISGVLTLANSTGTALVVTRYSQMIIRSFTTFSAVGSGSGQGVAVSDNSELVFSNLTTITISGGERALLVDGQSTVLCDAGAFTITATNNLRPAIDILDNSNVTFTVNGSLVATGTGGGARVRSNSRLSIECAAASLIASTNGPGLECSGGGRVYMPGGAGSIVTGLGVLGFGANCRGGGQAYFLAAPSAVTGPAGDLTVGSGGGETQANAFLAASLSGLISALSGIVRAS